MSTIIENSPELESSPEEKYPGEEYPGEEYPGEEYPESDPAQEEPSQKDNLQILKGGKDGTTSSKQGHKPTPIFPTFGGPLNRDSLKKQLKAVSIRMRFNERSQRREYSAEEEGKATEWKTADLDTQDMIFSNIQDDTRLRVKDNKGNEKIVRPQWGGAYKFGHREMTLRAYLVDHRVDPFVSWLRSLPEWDETDRLDYLFRLSGLTIADNIPEQYLRWASKMPFLAAVRRAFYPGTKFDTVIILSGKTGAGKSTFWRHSLPADGTEWFGDTLHLHGDEKQMLEACLGKVIVECAELSVKYSLIEKVKAFISRSNDNGIRLAYDSSTADRPRRFVIVGTTNEAEALPPDRTGLRRFWPVNIVDGDATRIRKWWDANREQVWAEAVAREGWNEQLWPPREIEELHEKIAESNRIKRSTEEEFVDKWLEQQNGEPFTLLDLMSASKAHPSGQHRPGSIRDGMITVNLNLSEAVVKASLRACGWQPVRKRDKDGRQRRFWVEKPNI